jgi:hypothetical protein
MRIPPWVLGGALAGAACVPRPEMCSQSECGAQSSCVAGRCVAQGAVVAISTARRLVFTPSDIACVRCGESRETGGETPAIARLGPTGGIVLLRFAIDLAPEATVVEAYIDLQRIAGAGDADPAPLALHALRITGPWDEGSVTWAGLPPLADVGAAVTRVREASGPLVRVDVRDLVQLWRRRERDEFGVAVIGEGAGASGMVFALRPTPAASRAPQLELYVK